MAAIWYAVAGLEDLELTKRVSLADDFWPFDESWDKSKRNPFIRNLEIAGALIAAEIDRRHAIYIDENCSEEQWVGYDDEETIKTD